mgnify:CR=1 FL=1
MELVTLENSDETLHVHDASVCYGEVCTVHNRSDHHMRGWPQHWRSDEAMMERICPHSIGHYDPDEYKIWSGLDAGFHSCDGCCSDKGDKTMVNVNGKDYEEQELDGNTILVPVKKKQKKVTIKLTKDEVKMLYDVMCVIGAEVENSTPRWEDYGIGEVCEFSDKVQEFATGLAETLSEDAEIDSWVSNYSDKFGKHLVKISQERLPLS